MKLDPLFEPFLKTETLQLNFCIPQLYLKIRSNLFLEVSGEIHRPAPQEAPPAKILVIYPRAVKSHYVRDDEQITLSRL
jgi:hypothetical protein